MRILVRTPNDMSDRGEWEEYIAAYLLYIDY
jgi:hypothetical protein